MIYEWNEAKRAANLAKHGVDFREAKGFDWETARKANPRERKRYERTVKTSKT